MESKGLLKKYMWPILVVVGLLFSGGVVLASIKEIKWLVDLLTFLGIVVSFCGLMVTLGQVDSVKKTAIKTKDAVLDNRKEIRKFLAFSEIGHLVEHVKIMQMHIQDEKYDIAILFMRELKDDLNRGKTEWGLNCAEDSDNMNDDPANVKITSLIRSLSMDIESITTHILFLKAQKKNEDSPTKGLKRSTIKPTVIIQNLENIRDYLISLESEFKGTKL